MLDCGVARRRTLHHLQKAKASIKAAEQTLAAAIAAAPTERTRSAIRQAAYRERQGDAGRAADAQRKRAARAAKKQPA